MSIKQQRIGMLVALRQTIAGIGYDAKNQTPESIKENMGILSESLVDILKIDGVDCILINEKQFN